MSSLHFMRKFKPGRPSLLYTIYLSLLLLSLFAFFHHNSHLRHNRRPDFRRLFLRSSSNSTLSSLLRSLTSHPHLAGTPPSSSTAHLVLSQLRSSGFSPHLSHHPVLLSYPRRVSLSALFPNSTSASLHLLEPVADAASLVPPYHAYSPSGSVLAPAVFVNYGAAGDYHTLAALGVGIRGCVAVARRGAEFRGAVVRRAAAEGAVAVLLYGEGDGGGVERGTVMAGGIGDPQTPGWASVDGGERLPQEDKAVAGRFPGVPSMPISAGNAHVILSSLGGPRVPEEWMDGSETGSWGGVGGGPTLVNFTYEEEKKIATIQNVFAIIEGLEEPDRYVLLGNHRDAWTYGAVDPNSGTAALLDIARRFGLLLKMGWKPRRTIVLCSWDAEEFGMIGSTEWVEQNLINLGSKGVAYLNVDCAVQGPGFFARATPQLDNLLIKVAKEIKDPDAEGKTVYQTWVAANEGVDIQRLSGVDSDYAAFLQHAGVPCIDLYYGKDFPVYHTAFDSYDWMEKYGDPLFQRHVAVAEIWGLLALHLVDDPILPFSYLSYGIQLQKHVKALRTLLDGRTPLDPIDRAIEELISAATGVEEEGKKLREEENVDGILELRRRALNDRLILAERGFLEANGLKEREWFKHLVYGPPVDYESNLSFFPGVADAIFHAEKMVNGGQLEVQHEIWRVARAIQRAAFVLRGQLW